MDVRILRISWIRTDFFYFLLETRHLFQKKSVRIHEIRKIRTSIRILIYVINEPFHPNFVTCLDIHHIITHH
ncbi:MAG: hypothetical protein RLZZ628_4283 [Bacteroidota bacterium]|jgi:hypothetical protein